VSNERERKSVGEQETFEVDTLDATFVLERAVALARTVWSRLESHGFRAFRTVTVTVRFENFITFARSRTGPRGVDERGGPVRGGARATPALPRRPPESPAPQNPPHRRPRGEALPLTRPNRHETESVVDKAGGATYPREPSSVEQMASKFGRLR
jgi:nucleotidyltransferase/DNA polymerase involved in DNA repair